MQKPRLQHVSCAVPAGTEDAVRAFYGRVLGLEEKPTPKALAGHNLVWYSVGDNEMELHFFPDPILPDPAGQYHLCLEVAALDLYRNRLTEAGYTIIEPSTIPHRPRFFCRDPFHNLLEFTVLEGNYNED